VIVPPESANSQLPKIGMLDHGHASCQRIANANRPPVPSQIKQENRYQIPTMRW